MPDKDSPTKTSKKKGINFQKRYAMNHPNRPKLGRAVIFSNEIFEDRKPSLTNRKGSDEDVKSLVAVFRKIGFEIDEEEDICKDFTDVEAIQKLEKLADEDLREYNCFFAVFLSHGDSGKLLMRKRELNIQGHILDHFRGNNCESLAGKPKIFLFQACRGIHIDEPVLGVDDESLFLEDTKRTNLPLPLKPEPEASEEFEDQIIVPAGADFLLCYASAEGYLSHRYPNKEKVKKGKLGSWFIQTFVDVINQYIDELKLEETEELDFLSLMTVVVDMVASISVKDEKTGRTAKRRQIPQVSSTLRKRIYFPNLTKPQVQFTEADENSSSDTEVDSEERNSTNGAEKECQKTEQAQENFPNLTPNNIGLVPLSQDIKAEEANSTEETKSKTEETKKNSISVQDPIPDNSNILPSSESIQAEQLNSTENNSNDTGGTYVLSGV